MDLQLGWNALFFANTLHVQQFNIKQDKHAIAITMSCVGAKNTKLVLYERRQRCCKEALLPGRTMKAWE